MNLPRITSLRNTIRYLFGVVPGPFSVNICRISCLYSLLVESLAAPVRPRYQLGFVAVFAVYGRRAHQAPVTAQLRDVLVQQLGDLRHQHVLAAHLAVQVAAVGENAVTAPFEPAHVRPFFPARVITPHASGLITSNKCQRPRSDSVTAATNSHYSCVPHTFPSAVS